MDYDDGTEKVSCQQKSKIWEYELKDLHECNGGFIKYSSPCNGICVAKDKWDKRTLLSGGKCLSKSDSWDCNGERIDQKEHCNGVCYRDSERPCGKKCKRKNAINNWIMNPSNRLKYKL